MKVKMLIHVSTFYLSIFISELRLLNHTVHTVYAHVHLIIQPSAFIIMQSWYTQNNILTDTSIMCVLRRLWFVLLTLKGAGR